MSIILVTGHARSGTTILRIVLDSHPDLAVTNEFGLLMPMGLPTHRYLLRVLRRWWSIKNRRDIFSPHIHEPSGPLDNTSFTLRYLFQVARLGRLGRVGAQAIEVGLHRLFPTARMVGDKYPEYIFALDRFATNPDITCFVIYRDVRDVAASNLEKVRTVWAKKRFARKVDTAEKVAHRWVDAIEAMERNAARIHVLRYESLVHDPTREMEVIGRRLGVDPAHFPAHLIRDTRIGRYQMDLTAQELGTVLEVAGPTARRLGYV